MGLLFNRGYSLSLFGYVDVYFSSDLYNQRSITNYVFSMGGIPMQ